MASKKEATRERRFDVPRVAERQIDVDNFRPSSVRIKAALHAEGAGSNGTQLLPGPHARLNKKQGPKGPCFRLRPASLVGVFFPLTRVAAIARQNFREPEAEAQANNQNRTQNQVGARSFKHYRPPRQSPPSI